MQISAKIKGNKTASRGTFWGGTLQEFLKFRLWRFCVYRKRMCPLLDEEFVGQNTLLLDSYTFLANAKRVEERLLDPFSSSKQLLPSYSLQNNPFSHPRRDLLSKAWHFSVLGCVPRINNLTRQAEKIPKMSAENSFSSWLWFPSPSPTGHVVSHKAPCQPVHALRAKS